MSVSVASIDKESSSISALTILVVEDDPVVSKLITMALQADGYQVAVAGDGEQAIDFLVETVPDLILCDLRMPKMDGYELLSRLRAHPDTAGITFLFLTAWDSTDDVIKGYDLGADDYISKPFELPVLRARVRAKLQRRRLIQRTAEEQQSEIVNQRVFLQEMNQELVRLENKKVAGCLASIGLYELERVTQRIGNIHESLNKQILALALYDRSPLEVVGQDEAGHFLLLMPELSAKEARQRLVDLAQRIAAFDFVIRAERVRFTPVIGYTGLAANLQASQLYDRSAAAAEHAAKHLDLEPVLYRPFMAIRSLSKRAMKSITSEFGTMARFALLRKHARTIFQIAATIFIGIVLPFILYVILGSSGHDITQVVYIFVIVALLSTALLIWWEGYLALRREDPPPPQITLSGGQRDNCRLSSKRGSNNRFNYRGFSENRLSGNVSDHPCLQHTP